VEVFWECLCKEDQIKKQAAACLKRLGLTLPLQYEGKMEKFYRRNLFHKIISGLFNDELREFTHDRSTCGCYFCLAKPYEYEK